MQLRQISGSFQLKYILRGDTPWKINSFFPYQYYFSSLSTITNTLTELSLNIVPLKILERSFKLPTILTNQRVQEIA